MTLTIPFDQPGKHVGHLRIPHSADDSAWGHVMVPVCVVQNGSGPTALVTGGNHGDEYEGPIAIRDLLNTLEPSDIQGRLIAIPSLNHPAFMAATRTSPIDGVNMNRAFPGNPTGTPTQRIAAFVNDHLIPLSDAVLDFHSGGKTLDFLPMALSHILDDADHDARCANAARAFAAPYTARLREIDDSGMLDGAAERAGNTFVTTEIGGAGTSTPASVRIAKDGLRRFLGHIGLMPATQPTPSTALDLSDPAGFHFAEHGGLLNPLVTLGDTIEPGQQLAQIYATEDLSAAPKSIIAQRGGLLSARHVPGLIKTGDCAFVIGTDGGPLTS